MDININVTENESINVNINGKQGIAGAPGEKGDKGDNGLSAYQTWLSLGNVGSEQEFIQSLAQGNVVCQTYRVVDYAPTEEEQAKLDSGEWYVGPSERESIKIPVPSGFEGGVCNIHLAEQSQLATISGIGQTVELRSRDFYTKAFTLVFVKADDVGEVAFKPEYLVTKQATKTDLIVKYGSLHWILTEIDGVTYMSRPIFSKLEVKIKQKGEYGEFNSLDKANLSSLYYRMTPESGYEEFTIRGTYIWGQPFEVVINNLNHNRDLDTSGFVNDDNNGEKRMIFLK